MHLAIFYLIETRHGIKMEVIEGTVFDFDRALKAVKEWRENAPSLDRYGDPVDKDKLQFKSALIQ